MPPIGAVGSNTTSRAGSVTSVPKAPVLTRVRVSAELSAAAKELLKLSEGNDVSVARFKAKPAELAELGAHRAAFREWLYRTGMNISSRVPTSAYAKHSVRHSSLVHLGKPIFDFAQVPVTEPETAASRASRAKALADANVLAAELHRTGGDLYLIHWTNQDDTVVNILAAVNTRSGELAFVKLFPAI